MKLCVFQGTFNPIHNAHMSMARYIRDHKDKFDYDSILFIPAYKPPHKDIDDDLANHRFQMAKLAISGESGFAISNIEFQNNRFSYTYYTIEELYKRYKIDGKIGFIIGFDAFRDITDWYESDKLKNLVHFILFGRGDELDKDRLALLHYKGYEYSFANMPLMDISSTKIRENVENGRPIGAFVPPEVAEYIGKNGLYRNE